MVERGMNDVCVRHERTHFPISVIIEKHEHSINMTLISHKTYDQIDREVARTMQSGGKNRTRVGSLTYQTRPDNGENGHIENFLKLGA